MTAEQRKEYMREYMKEYRKRNREKLREYSSVYWKTFYNGIRRKKYRNNPEYRMKELERKRIERNYRAENAKDSI